MTITVLNVPIQETGTLINKIIEDQKMKLLKEDRMKWGTNGIKMHKVAVQKLAGFTPLPHFLEL